jgi:hypothetical protein
MEVQLTARGAVHVDTVAVGVEVAAAGTEGCARLCGCSASSHNVISEQIIIWVDL